MGHVGSTSPVRGIGESRRFSYNRPQGVDLPTSAILPVVRREDTDA